MSILIWHALSFNSNLRLVEVWCHCITPDNLPWLGLLAVNLKIWIWARLKSKSSKLGLTARDPSIILKGNLFHLINFLFLHILVLSLHFQSPNLYHMFVHLTKCQNKPLQKIRKLYSLMILIQWPSHTDSLPEKRIEYDSYESILQLSRLLSNSKRYLTLVRWQSNRASWVNWSWFFYLSRFILYPSKSHPNPQLILLCLFSVQNMPLFRSLKRDTPRLQNVFKLR